MKTPALFAVCSGVAVSLAVALAQERSPGATAATRRAAATAYQFRYHTYDESTALLEGLAARYSTLATLGSLGKSAMGRRELWYLEIGTQQSPAKDEPAVYFDGNQHASEVMGGEVTLYLAHYLLTRYGDDPDVTRLLDTRTIYIVPRADPDGAEVALTGRLDWDPAKAPGARDVDGDGRRGEDGPEDINGDGRILRMRRPDPAGEWKPYTADERLLVRREKRDTTGPFYTVIDEGLDNDADGKVNEDPPVVQFISNRNYPAFWSSDNGRFRGQGHYPLQEHNARLLVDFIVSRPHISQVESFHTTSGIHLRPYAARPDTQFPTQDLLDYQAVLARGTQITTYPVASVYNDFTDIDPKLAPDEQPDVRHGVFIDWAYVHQGLFAITTELWTMEPFVNEVGWGDIPRDRPLFAIPGRYSRPDVQAAVLRWLDAHAGDARLGREGFVPWQAFAHPTLGTVELGGFSQFWLRNPPPGPLFERIAVDQARFAVVQALTTPLVAIRALDARPMDSRSDEWVVTAVVANEGYLDTSMEQARLAGIATPVTATLTLPGSVTTTSPRAVSFPFLRGTRGSSFVSLYRAEWRVRGAAGAVVDVTLQSEKGGTVRRAVTLK